MLRSCRRIFPLLLAIVLGLSACGRADYGEGNDFPAACQEELDAYLSQLDDADFGGCAYAPNGDFVLYVLDNDTAGEIDRFAQEFNAKLEQEADARSRLKTQQAKYSYRELLDVYHRLEPLIDQGDIMSTGILVPHNRVIVGVRELTGKVKHKVYEVAEEDQVEFEIVSSEVELH